MASAKPPMTPRERAAALLKLARRRFDHDLHAAERAMLRHAAMGEMLTLPANGDGAFDEAVGGDGTGPTQRWDSLYEWLDGFRAKCREPLPGIDPATTTREAWLLAATERSEAARTRLTSLPETNRHITIRADRLRWLLADPQAQRLTDPLGVRISGAVIAGRLNLMDTRVARPLVLSECAVTIQIVLARASIPQLSLPGCAVPGLVADGLAVKGGVFLRDGFHAAGEVRLLGASIGGDLDCSRSTFHDPSGDALSGDRLAVKGSVFLREGFHAAGEIRLLVTSVGGQLECSGGTFQNPSGYALSCHRARIGGGVFLRTARLASRTSFVGCVSFQGARLGGLNASGARFNAQKNHNTRGSGALDLTEAEVRGSVLLGSRACDDDQNQVAHTEVEGSVLLDRARIAGALDLAGGDFKPWEDELAIVGTGVRVGGQVFMNRLAAGHEPFRAKGPVVLHGAQLGGDLFLCEGQFDNAGQTESMDGSTRPRAALSLARSTIKGLLQIDSCRHRSASPIDDQAGPLGRATDGEVCRFRGPLDLCHVRVGIFRDDVATWEKSRTTGEIRLDGFVYDALGPGAPVRASDRLKLLARMPAGEFNSQPYEHLALLLDKMGHDDDAREVLTKEASRRHWFEWRYVGDWGSTILCSILLASSIAWAGFEVLFGTPVLLFAALVVTGIIALGFSAGRRSADFLVRVVLRVTLDYGYRPLMPLIWLALLLSIGWAFFGWAASRTEQLPAYAGGQPEPVGLFAPASDQVLTWAEYTGKLTPTGGSQPIDVSKRPAEYPRFNPLVFAADTMLPIIDLHQEQYWQVDPRKGAVVSIWGRDYSEGEIVRAYLWCHILAGWTLTTLFIVGLTGLVRGHKAEQVAE